VKKPSVLVRPVPSDVSAPVGQVALKPQLKIVIVQPLVAVAWPDTTDPPAVPPPVITGTGGVGVCVTVAVFVGVPVGVLVRVAVVVGVEVLVGELVGVLVGVWVAEIVAVGVFVAVELAVGVTVGVFDGVELGVFVRVLVGVLVAVAVLVGVTVPVATPVGVLVPVAVMVGVLVDVPVGVLVGVRVGVFEAVAVGVFVGVLVRVFVGEAVGVVVDVLVAVGAGPTMMLPSAVAQAGFPLLLLSREQPFGGGAAHNDGPNWSALIPFVCPSNVMLTTSPPPTRPLTHATTTHSAPDTLSMFASGVHPAVSEPVTTLVACTMAGS
jgi:hypothetical protein